MNAPRHNRIPPRPASFFTVWSAPLLGSIICVAIFFLLVYPDEKSPEPVEGVWVTAVDGDTLKYQGQSLRLINVDTPEPTQYGNAECPEEAALGDKASRYVKDLVSRNKVVIVYSGRNGGYGRPLVNVLVDGKDLGEMLIAEGLAEPWRGHQADWCRILK